MEIKFIVQNCKDRDISHLKKEIPNLIVNYDDFPKTDKKGHTAWLNYQRGWQLAGENPTVQMDDDIILCDDFYNRIIKEIEKRPNDVMQFFSMRKADLEIGSRYEPGYKFLMQQCYYLPFGLAKEIYNFSFKFILTTSHQNCPSDPCIAEYLKIKKLKYWVVVPNLVDHKQGKSAIGGRSSKRQSKTFLYEC